jgi:hypothetical protein
MAFQNLPASDKIIESIRSNITSPLEEMEERQATTKILTNVIEEQDEEAQSV